MNLKHLTIGQFSYFKFEIAIIITLSVLKFTVMDWLNMRAFFIIGVCFFWLSYIYYRHRIDKSVLAKWGISRNNLLKSLFLLLPFVVLTIILSIIYGKNTGTSVKIWHLLPVLALYPVWGTFQQFIVIALIVQNLYHRKTSNFRKLFLVFIGALFFSLIHSPDFLLMSFSFFMEILFILVFLKDKNLWALGLAHGLVATFFIYFVQGRDLWIELFSWFLN
jgi:hypothetical protein